MNTLDITIVVAYLGAIGSLGIYLSRRQKTTDDYFLAGRRVPGWIVGFSVLGTIVSSATFVGHPSNSFRTDLWEIPRHVAVPIVMFIVARYLVVFYRRKVRMTAYDYLEQRFNYFARAYGALTFIVSRIADVSVTYYFLAVAIAYMTDWSIWRVILVMGIVTLIYTLLGGVQAVVWTDVIQGVLLVVGGIICLSVVLSQPAAGPAAVISKAWEGGRMGLGNWEFSLTENNGWLYVLGGVITAVKLCACDQNMVQRYLLARSDREAVRAATFGAAACLPVWLIFMLLGAFLWAFYEITPNQLPPEVVERGDFLVPHFIRNQIPPRPVGPGAGRLDRGGHVVARFRPELARLRCGERLLRATPSGGNGPHAAADRQGSGLCTRRGFHPDGPVVDARGGGDRVGGDGRHHPDRWNLGFVRAGILLSPGDGPRGVCRHRRLRAVHRLGHSHARTPARHGRTVVRYWIVQLCAQSLPDRNPRQRDPRGGRRCHQCHVGWTAAP